MNNTKKVTTGVYLIRDNKILFLVRNKKNDTLHKQGMYLPIGGHVELNESIENAAIREVKEEATIAVHSIELAGICNFRDQNQAFDVIMYTFISSDFSGEPVAGREGHFAWINLADIQSANLYPGDKVYLQYMLKNKFFVIDFFYKDFELLDYTVLKVI